MWTIEAHYRLLTAYWVWLYGLNQRRFSHPADKGFMTDECGTAIDILALVYNVLWSGVCVQSCCGYGRRGRKGGISS
ncbi:hypothetical protein XCR1_2410002 [Xenorhabdus cabanillasii JM26]|uniref:Uncharacterized protein n=1 Tax=Xenorhabdus cabanillasii JM26 TaxID=1427517 RepID=W1J8I5_9GAMM|nr:hypothetical protein XCR1_2410002 [Xenorhabdus cabanillasii JM26]